MRAKFIPWWAAGYRCLSWVDLAFLSFGFGILMLTSQEASFDAGPAVSLAYDAAGFSALLSSFCYAGGSFCYLLVEHSSSWARRCSLSPGTSCSRPSSVPRCSATPGPPTFFRDRV